MKQRFLFIILHLVSLCVFAQKANDNVVPIDSVSIVIDRDFNDDISQKYSGDEFNYTIKTGESQNLLTRFLKWVGQGLSNIFGIELSPQLLKFLEFFIYFIMALLTIYLLLKMFTNERFDAIFTKKAKVINAINLTEDHIESIDLNNLLSAALLKQDYRLAIRYQFLITLQKLSQKDIIQWHFDKTNSDYINEIQPQALQLKFQKIAYLYDYIWYGEQTIDEPKYKKSVSDFEAMNNQISQ